MTIPVGLGRFLTQVAGSVEQIIQLIALDLTLYSIDQVLSILRDVHQPRHQIDAGQRPGPTTEERERIKALERENRELRKANEILRLASAYFAQAELDRRTK